MCTLKSVVKCNHLLRCNRTCMVSVTSASRNVTSACRYQSRSSIYIRDLIPWNSTELAEAVPIANIS